MFNDTLPEFQKFLASRKLVPEKNLSYYAHWVSKFLAFSSRIDNASHDVQKRAFLDHLMPQKDISDWQVRQAEQALQLYIEHFLKGASRIFSFNPLTHSNITEIIVKMREAIRIKHFSYRTERSYIDWAKRFYAYVINVKKKNLGVKGLNSDDVREFLSYLAVKQQVASSTQNQAFNALIFLFRDVLKIDLKDFDKTVRAKRGPKLPVVLTVEEIQELFKYIEGKNLLILQLLYGSGLRLMELARLRAKDIDFNANLIFVRGGKQDKDRSTILPESAKDRLQMHLKEVKSLHEKDIEAGYGEVYLPNAFEHKYPGAGKDWCWEGLVLAICFSCFKSFSRSSHWENQTSSYK